MAYTVSDFLTLVRQYAMLPSTTANGTADADILRVADEELRTRVTPLVIASGQEWWVSTYRTALTASQRVYKVPARAIGGRVRDVQLRKSDGSYKNLRRCELEESYGLDQAATGEPELFWLKGESLYLWPKPATTSGHLHIDYHARPGRLTNTSPTNYAILTCADSTGDTVAFTTTTAPVTVSSSGYVDIVRAGSGFSMLATDVYGASTAGPIFTATSKYTLPDDYASILVGDYLFPADTCFVIPLPTELHGVFVYYVAAALLRQLGKQNHAFFEDTAGKMAAASLQSLAPRVAGEPRYIRNGGILWRSKSNWWR